MFLRVLIIFKQMSMYCLKSYAIKSSFAILNKVGYNIMYSK